MDPRIVVMHVGTHLDQTYDRFVSDTTGGEYPVVDYDALLDVLVPNLTGSYREILDACQYLTYGDSIQGMDRVEHSLRFDFYSRLVELSLSLQDQLLQYCSPGTRVAFREYRRRQYWAVTIGGPGICMAGT